MSPVTRKLARLTGELGSIERRLKNVIAEVQQLELDSRALANAKQINGNISESVSDDGSIAIF